MGIIYYRWTATCLLEFQAAYLSRDLQWSIFTFQLQLNRHDKHTQQRASHGHTSFSYCLLAGQTAGLNAKVPDMMAEGAEYSGEKSKRWEKNWRGEEASERRGGWWEQVNRVCIWAFRWVSIIQGERMGSWPLKSIHGKGVFTVNINICVCAMARATLDKPTAVNYELACREGDKLVNMQS